MVYARAEEYGGDLQRIVTIMKASIGIIKNGALVCSPGQVETYTKETTKLI